MKDVQGAPFFLRLGARMRGPEGTPVGRLKRINISNVVAYGANPDYASLLFGIPGYDIEDIKMDNITIFCKGGATAEQAALEVPEKEKAYPDPQEFGKIPAYGFYIRHAKNVVLTNIALKLENTDARPAFILEDVKGASLFNVTAEHGTAVPVFVLKSVNNFTMKDCGSLPDKTIEKAENIKL
jgi:hypothetical protein